MGACVRFFAAPRTAQPPLPLPPPPRPLSCGCSRPLSTGPPSPFAVLWDARSRHVAAEVVPVGGGHPLLSCALDAEGGSLLCGGIDGAISCFDLRANGGGGGGGIAPAPLFRIAAHGDGVCSLSFSPDGTRALAGALDGGLATWDVRPFCAAPSRHLASFSGATQSAEANLVRGGWSGDGERVAGGSSDKIGRVWDAGSGQLLLSLPGHTGCVTEAAFHPTEGVVATCGDKTVWLSEVR
jgi:Prp8 binding protein